MRGFCWNKWLFQGDVEMMDFESEWKVLAPAHRPVQSSGGVPLGAIR